MPHHEIHTVHEMQEQWFPHAPFEAVKEFWESLHIVVLDDATPQDWERHGRAYRELQRYRMLYFFHGRTAAVVSHGITKQQAVVPPKEIEKAVQRKIAFEAHPQRHTFTPPED